MGLFDFLRAPDVARLEASRDIQGLAKVARTARDWTKRRDALLAVHRLGGPDVLPLTLLALQDDYWKNREIGAELLGEKGDERAVEPLLAATADGYISVRWAAIGALSHVLARTHSGPPDATVVRALVQRLADQAWWVRQSAAQALRQLASLEHYDALEPAIRPLHHALQDEVRAVRQAALEVLIALNAPPTIDSLVMALVDEAWSVRLSAAEALETLGWRPDAEHEIDYWIAMGEPRLALVRGTEALPALMRVLGDQYPPLRAEAVAALAELGLDAVPALLNGLHHRDWWAREAAAEALGRIKPRGAVLALIESLSDQSKGVREAASRALGALGDGRAVPYLSALKRYDSQPSVRMAAQEALSGLPEPADPRERQYRMNPR